MSELFHSFQPLQNPVGFGASDFLLFAFAALSLVLLGLRKPMEQAGRWFALRPRLAMLLFAALPVVLRLAMLPAAPVPTPSGVDDFAHLLVGDTLAHFRLANPAHPLHQFFETNFVLQEPRYSSIYPLGQGIALAIGQVVFGHPWAGVVLSVAVFCGLSYWMLLGWTTPGWAIIGGLLAVMEFGPLRYWMNTYWGGAVSAAAGCLIFGALPRLRAYGKLRDAALLGLGFAVQFLTRPFEAILAAFCAALFFFFPFRFPLPGKQAVRGIGIVVLAVLPAFGLTVLHNRAVTGNFLTLPYQLSQYQYGIPASFTFQPNPVPHRTLTQEQQLDYQAQVAVHGNGPDTWAKFWQRLEERFRFVRFFFFAPLYLALPFFLPAIRERRFAWIALCLAIFVVGTNFYPYFYPHYVAVVCSLLLLVTVVALERLSRWSERGARLLITLAAAQFLFWYGFHLAGNTEISRTVTQWDTWDFVNHGDPEGRIAIHYQLEAAPGKQLVFVHYWPRHRFDEWVANAADIDGSRVVTALDLGTEENEKLRRYYPDRTAWLLEPDARPPKVTPYQVETPKQVEPQIVVPSPKPNVSPKKPTLQFEPVR